MITAPELPANYRGDPNRELAWALAAEAIDWPTAAAVMQTFVDEHLVEEIRMESVKNEDNALSFIQGIRIWAPSATANPDSDAPLHMAQLMVPLTRPQTLSDNRQAKGYVTAFMFDQIKLAMEREGVWSCSSAAKFHVHTTSATWSHKMLARRERVSLDLVLNAGSKASLATSNPEGQDGSSPGSQDAHATPPAPASTANPGSARSGARSSRRL